MLFGELHGHDPSSARFPAGRPISPPGLQNVRIAVAE